MSFPLLFCLNRRLNIFLEFLGILLICILSFLQGLGFCQQLEQSLLKHLPARFLPETQPVVLITLEKKSHGFQAMDVAMALRGLGQFHPRCIIINGLIAPEQGPVPFLPDILSRFKAMPGLTLIVPQLPSPTAQFQSIALIRYSLTVDSPSWPKLEGAVTPGIGAAYLPISMDPDSALPLFATTSHGVPIGSLWWWSLPESLRKSPPLLLFNRLLLFGTHSQIQLTPLGSFNPSLPGKLIEMPLDDFLLQIEQKEQGTISPTFDSLWDKNIVIVGASSDLSKASALSSFLQEISWHHFPVWLQFSTMIGWILLFLFFRKQPLLQHRYLPLLILLILFASTLLFLHYGIIITFLPGLGVALLLLIPGSDKR